MTTKKQIEAGAQTLAEWIGYEWIGLSDVGAAGFPEWGNDGIGQSSYQGGKQGLRALALRILQLEE